MTKKSVQFYYNNQKEGEPVLGLSEKMKLFVCMQGEDAQIRPHMSEEVPAEVTRIVDRMHVLHGIPEFEEIEGDIEALSSPSS
jgi:Flp pilus assembly CpaE family ATPase